MKRSFDSFQPSQNCEYTLNPWFSRNELPKLRDDIKSLPEDLVLLVFVNLSSSAMRELSSVYKAIEIYAKNDISWQSMAEEILLFSHDIESKPKVINYKNENGYPLSSFFPSLKPQTSDFINCLTTKTLPDFKLLSPSETKALMQMTDTSKLIEAVSNEFNDSLQDAIHAQVEFFNTTSQVTRLNVQRIVHLNNKLAGCFSNPSACQVLMHIRDEYFYMYRDNVENMSIHMLVCNDNHAFQ